MEDWGAACDHDINEREVATVADGLCPLCLAASCAALRQRVEELEWVEGAHASCGDWPRERTLRAEKRVGELEAKLKVWSDWEAMLHAQLERVVGGGGRGCDSLVETLRLRLHDREREIGVRIKEILIAEAKLARCVEALEVALGYVRATEGQLVTRPNIVTKDRELGDAALAAAKEE